MGFLDKFKGKSKQDDDDLDDLDVDSPSGENNGAGDDDDDAPASSGGRFGGALGLLNKVKKLSSGGEGEDGGGFGSLLGKVKGLTGGKKKSGDPDFDDLDDMSEQVAAGDKSALGKSDNPDADQDEEEEAPTIRRSAIAAKLDQKSEPTDSSDEGNASEEAAIPVPVTAGGVGGLDLGSLFEEEFVVDPRLKDLAESLDHVSAVDLAADLRSFLDELQ